jgi:hypothetical protein
MDWKKSGYLVETKTGKLGRTIHEKESVNGKIPVYLATKMSDEKHGVRIPLEFSDKAILCDPTTLKQIGFID